MHPQQVHRGPISGSPALLSVVISVGHTFLSNPSSSDFFVKPRNTGFESHLPSSAKLGHTQCSSGRPVTLMLGQRHKAATVTRKERCLKYGQ